MQNASTAAAGPSAAADKSTSPTDSHRRRTLPTGSQAVTPSAARTASASDSATGTARASSDRAKPSSTRAMLARIFSPVFAPNPGREASRPSATAAFNSSSDSTLRSR